MSNCFEGSVRAQAYKVKMALENYERQYKLSSQAKSVALNKSYNEKRFYKKWFWEVELTVHDAIKKGYHGDYCWWGEYPPLSVAYPDIYTTEDVKVLHQSDLIPNSIKPLFKHNPNEFYLNADQARWVNNWAEKVTEVH